MSSVIHTHLDITRQYSCSGLEHLDITKQYNCSGLEHLDVTRQYNCLGQVHLDITRQHNCLGPEHLDITRQHICLGPEHLDITRQYNCLGPEHLDVTGQYNCLGLEHLDVTRQYNCLRPEHLDITRIILTPLGSTAAQDCMDQKMSFLSPPPSPKKNCTPFGNATHIRIFFFFITDLFSCGRPYFSLGNLLTKLGNSRKRGRILCSDHCKAILNTSVDNWVLLLFPGSNSSCFQLLAFQVVKAISE